MSARRYMVHRGLAPLFGAVARTRPRTRFRLRWLDLARPGDGYWPYPHSVDEAMQGLIWALEREDGAPGRNVPDLVTGHGCRGTRATDPHLLAMLRPDTLARDLGGVFERLVLVLDGSSAAIQDWRERVGIRCAADSVVTQPPLVTRRAWPSGSGPIADQDEVLRRFAALLSVRGRVRGSPNECHRRARTALRCWLRLGWRGTSASKRCPARRLGFDYVFDLEYGYASDEHGWHLELARQGPGETFVELLVRAERALDGLLESRVAPTHPPRKRGSSTT